MKYILLIAVAGLSSVFAFADDTSTNARPVGGKEVQYDCQFHSRKDKNVSCRVSGEVCVNFRRTGTNTVVPSGCDHERDDNRMRIECTDGFRDRDRAISELFERDRSATLLIKGVDRRRDDVSTNDRRDRRRDDVIEIRDFDFDRDLNLDRERDRDDFRARFLREDGGSFWGRCEIRLEREERP